MTEEIYTSIIETLTKRISDLVPSHPEILATDNPFDLFKIEDFKCDDLQPSLNQAAWALAQVKLRNKE